MGLQSFNYEVKQIGQTLPMAYAMLHSVNQVKNSVVATFAIYKDRESADKYQPLETKKIHFNWDRKTDVAKQAYEIAKKEGGIFEGWIDHIV
jgi:hypothetical protein